MSVFTLTEPAVGSLINATLASLNVINGLVVAGNLSSPALDDIRARLHNIETYLLALSQAINLDSGRVVFRGLKHWRR